MCYSGKCIYENNYGDCTILDLERPADAYCVLLEQEIDNIKSFQKIYRIKDAGDNLKFEEVELSDLEPGDLFYITNLDGDIIEGVQKLLEDGTIVDGTNEFLKLVIK